MGPVSRETVVQSVAKLKPSNWQKPYWAESQLGKSHSPHFTDEKTSQGRKRGTRPYASRSRGDLRAQGQEGANLVFASSPRVR